MTYKIERGDRFKCIKTFKMDDCQKAYIKGKTYLSEVDKCITDEELDLYHNMENVDGFFNYFVYIQK